MLDPTCAAATARFACETQPVQAHRLSTYECNWNNGNERHADRLGMHVLDADVSEQCRESRTAQNSLRF